MTENIEQPAVLLIERRVEDLGAVAEPVRARVDQRQILQMLVPAARDRIDRDQPAVERRPARSQEALLMQQVLAHPPLIAMPMPVAPEHVLVAMAPRQERRHLLEDVPVAHAPRDPREIEALHVLLVEEAQQLLRRSMLRDPGPGPRIDLR